MKKDENQLKQRRQFVKTALNDPKAAAKVLRRKAKGLENCRNTTDTVEALKDILYLKEGQIFIDNSSIE